MVFASLPSKKKSVFAAEQIIAAIAEGHYGVGDKLPTEAELGAQMGVSRTAIREAVSALRLNGILDSVPGAGTFVAKPVSGIQIGSSTVFATTSKQLSVEAWQARSAIEDGIVGMAVKKLSAGEGLAELEALRESLDKMETAAELTDYEGYISANSELHVNVARITGNGLLVSTVESLIKSTDAYLTTRVNPDLLGDFLQSSFAKHQAVVTGIAARDEQAARRAILDHFDELELYYALKSLT